MQERVHRYVPKNKTNQNVQIQKDTSQASATTVACDCTIEIGQR